MAHRTLTIGCRQYDHIRALTDGRVRIDGVDLQFVHLSPPSRIFLRMLRDEAYDLSEMSLSSYMMRSPRAIGDSSVCRFSRPARSATPTYGFIRHPASRNRKI